MTSQLRHNFQVSQVEHGLNGITTTSRVNSMSARGPQVETLIYYIRLECSTLFYET